MPRCAARWVRCTRTSPTSSSSTFKVRILDAEKGTGAIIRVLVDASDGQDPWGSIGVSPNLIEASWQALVDSLAYAIPNPTGRRMTPDAEATSPDPHGAAGDRRALSELVLEVLALRPALARSEDESRSRTCLPPGSACPSGAPCPRHGRPPSRVCAPSAWSRSTRWSPSRSDFIASANSVLFERAIPRRRHRPVTLNMIRRPLPMRSGPRPRRSCRCTSSSTRPIRRDGSPRPAHRRRRLRGARRVHADGVPVGGARPPAVFAFYANKQLATGEAAWS